MAGGTPTPRARWLAAAVAAIAYAAVSYTLMTRARDSAWSLLVVLGPLVVLATAAAWGNGQRVLAAAGLLAAVLLAVFAASGRGLPARWLYLAQHAGVHLALAAWFGSTLRKGAEPLVSALARRVHGSLTQTMARYTRQVTLAWTLYFLAMVAASLALFTAGDFAHWSLLADVLTPVLTGAFFVGE
ncbi:MAG: acyl carrier protein, partial [Burkholderiales bacterium]